MNKKLKEIIPYIIILIVVVIVRTYFVTPITVVGSSMVPTLHNKELLLLSKISYKINNIERFDVVVIKEDEWIIKRVIGLPGENIEYKNKKLYINGKLVEDLYEDGETNDFDMESICNITNIECENGKIPKDYYLVLGDNRKISKDSRSIGLIPKNEIKGKAIVRFWPLNKISIVK